MDGDSEGAAGVPQCILCRLPHKFAAFLAAEHGKPAGRLVLDVPSSGVVDRARLRLRVGGSAHSVGVTVRGVVLECFRREGMDTVALVDELRCSFGVEKSELAWLQAKKDKRGGADDDEPPSLRLTASICEILEEPQTSTRVVVPSPAPVQSEEAHEHATESRAVPATTAKKKAVKEKVKEKKKKKKKTPEVGAAVAVVPEEAQIVVPAEGLEHTPQQVEESAEAVGEDVHDHNEGLDKNSNGTEKEPEDVLVIRNAAEYNMYAELFSQKHARYDALLDSLERCRSEVRGLEAAVATARAQRLPYDAKKAREQLAGYERAHFVAAVRRVREARRLHRTLVRVATAMHAFVRAHEAQHTLAADDLTD